MSKDIEEVVKELQKCPDCKGNGTLDCEQCEEDSHDCSRCLGGGILYEVDIEKVRTTLQSQADQYQKEKREMVKEMLVVSEFELIKNKLKTIAQKYGVDLSE